MRQQVSRWVMFVSGCCRAATPSLLLADTCATQGGTTTNNTLVTHFKLFESTSKSSAVKILTGVNFLQPHVNSKDCCYSPGPTAPPVSHSCDWSRCWRSSRRTRTRPWRAWCPREASPSPVRGWRRSVTEEALTESFLHERDDIFNTGCQLVSTRRPRGGNARRERCPCAGPTLAGSYLCRRWGSWCRLCSSRRCRWGQCECCRSSPRPPRGPRSTGSPRYRSLRGESRNSFSAPDLLIRAGLHETSAGCCTFTGWTSSISAQLQFCSPSVLWSSHEGVIPALISTLWATGCQLRMPTRLEWPSSLTTGSVSGEVSPPSGISQIYLPRIKPQVKQSDGETWRTAGWLLGDRCYHDAAVLRAAGNDVVIVRTELDFQDRTCVAADSRVGHVDTSRLQTEEQ